MNFIEKENKFIEKHPLAKITKEGDVYTIVMTVNSYGFFEAMRALKPDNCCCGCYECMRGRHSQCESDGQSCYYSASRRVDDGIWNRQPVAERIGSE